MTLSWSPRLEDWPYARAFIIARVRMLTACNLVVKVSDGVHIGMGEAEPHEADRMVCEKALQEAQSYLTSKGSALTRTALAGDLPAGPIRNAIDCALWDFEAKRDGRTVAELFSITLQEKLPITATISMDVPDVMAEEAADKAADASILKLKLGGTAGEDRARLNAVRQVAPQHRIIIDANEGWTLETLTALAGDLEATRVELIEQPLPRREDAALLAYRGSIPLCADESVTDCASLDALVPAYKLINIKLDKCGGLTEGVALAKAARARGLDFIVGSNGGTSLAAAPAYHLASMGAVVADIDSPTLLKTDRTHAMTFSQGFVSAPNPSLWGG